MKKIILSTMMLLFMGIVAKAQKQQIFRKFKGDVAFGFAVPSGSGSKGGILFAIEPKYTFFDKLAVGARIEIAATARVTSYDIYGDAEDAEVKASSSYIATADYYFTTTKMRPFIGAGGGLYTFASTTVNTNSDEVPSFSKFGGMLRAGFEVSHFRLGLEYNFVPENTYSYLDLNTSTLLTGTNKNGYFSIKVGAFFGGGRLASAKKPRD